MKFGDSLAVPVVDFTFNNDGNPDWLFLDYTWYPSSAAENFEAREVEMLEFNPLATLANYHTALHNVSPQKGKDNGGLASFFQHHEDGAYTSYFGQDFFSTRDIGAGEELFDDYGHEWLETRSNRFGELPYRKHYDMADQIVFNLSTWADRERNSNGSIDVLLQSVKTIVSLYDRKTSSILPSTAEELKMAQNFGSAKSSVKRRTVSWIKKHGVCMDNISLGKSSVANAGQGAFAKRFIPKGGRITVVPLLHIMDKSTFNTHNGTDTSSGRRRRTGKVIGKQLLLNYCFGSSKSTLLLCPSNGAVLVNHASNRSCTQAVEPFSAEGPNAEVAWSAWDNKTRSWLLLTFEELGKQQGQGLSFDIVSKRDIQKGEEIFIDYGEDWERAWCLHKSEWEPPLHRAESYTSPRLMEAKHQILRTKEELQIDQYPSNIMTACIDRGGSGSKPSTNVDTDLRETINRMSSDELIDRFSTSGKHILPKARHEEYDDYMPCVVYRRDRGGKSYTVRIFDTHNDLETLTDSNGFPRFLTTYPRASIRFVNRPYTSDMFLPGAFRHPIGLNDGMITEQWKNLNRP